MSSLDRYYSSLVSVFKLLVLNYYSCSLCKMYDKLIRCMALQMVLLTCMFLFAFSVVSFNEQGFDSNQALCIFCCYLSFVFLRIHWFSAKPKIVAVYPSSPPVLRAMGLFQADSVCDVLFDFPVAIMKYSNKQLKGERTYMTFNYRFHQTGTSQHQGHMISIVKSRKLEINVCMLVFCPLL